MSRTCINKRSEATRPVNRPTLVRPVPVLPRSWSPPPETHSATTISMEDQTNTPKASRHQPGTRDTGTEVWRLPIPDERPLDFRFDDVRGANNVSAEKSMAKDWPHIFGDSCELSCELSVSALLVGTEWSDGWPSTTGIPPTTGILPT
jgi:hypothetical protein